MSSRVEFITGSPGHLRERAPLEPGLEAKGALLHTSSACLERPDGILQSTVGLKLYSKPLIGGGGGGLFAAH